MKTTIITVIIIILIIIGYSFTKKTNTSIITNTENISSSTAIVTQVVNKAVVPTENASTKTVAISIVNFAFNPESITINKGDSVTWTNNDSAPHQILGTGFKSTVLGNGQSYTFTFNTVATFDYICNIHKSMKGQIVVK